MLPRFFCTSKLQKWTDAGVMRDQLGPFLPRDGECDRLHVGIIASRHPECAAPTNGPLAKVIGVWEDNQDHGKQSPPATDTLNRLSAAQQHR